MNVAACLGTPLLGVDWRSIQPRCSQWRRNAILERMRVNFLAADRFDAHARQGWRAGVMGLALTLLSLSEGFAMGLTGRLVLFSEMHGTVLKDGKPVQGAALSQQVVWSDNKDEISPVRVLTGPDGGFLFAAVERDAGLIRLVPHQPVILQKILIHYNGIDYVAWRHTKDSYDVNSELGGRALKLTCELNRAPDFEGTHYGICTVD